MKMEEVCVKPMVAKDVKIEQEEAVGNLTFDHASPDCGQRVKNKTTSLVSESKADGDGQVSFRDYLMTVMGWPTWSVPDL